MTNDMKISQYRVVVNDHAERFTEVTVVNQERYDDGPFDFGASYESGSLNRVIDSLIAIRNSIPAEHRGTACCEIDSASGYEGSHYPTIKVVYTRSETEEERIQREHVIETTALRQEQNERTMYEKLKAKFESGRE